MVQRVPQPLWQLFYQGQNITADIEAQTMEVQWSEHIGGEAADVQVTIEDVAGKWRGSSYPTVGQDQIVLYIGYAGASLLYCGVFTLDELQFDGPPDRVTLKGIEAATTTPLRTAQNFAYENMTFAQIAQAVAARHGYQCVNLPTTPNVPWARRTQTLEHGGDLNFLQMLANEANYEFNVRPPNLIFYSRASLDKQPPSNTITRSMVDRYSFRFQSAAELTYGASTVSDLDPVTKKVYSAMAKVAGVAPTADVLNTVERLESNQHAALKAQSRLYEANMLMYQLTVEMPGTINFRAGQTAALPSSDWGVFGGTWTVARATHRIRARSGGYKTTLVLRQASTDTGSVIVPGDAEG